MSYEIAVDEKSGYLHAIVTGQNSVESVMRYMEDLHRECAARGCFRVLIEERLVGPRLGTPDIFRIASEGSGKSRGVFTAIAYVDVHAEGDLMKFAETVSVNRGLPVAVFSSVSEAERWLAGKP